MTELSDTLDEFNGTKGCRANHQYIQDLVEDKWVHKYGRENVFININLRKGKNVVGEMDVLALTPYGPRVAEIKSCRGVDKAKKQAKGLRVYFNDPTLDVILVSPYRIKRL